MRVLKLLGFGAQGSLQDFRFLFAHLQMTSCGKEGEALIQAHTLVQALGQHAFMMAHGPS